MDFLREHGQVSLDGEWSFAYSMGPLPDEPTTMEAIALRGCEVRLCTVPGNLELDLQAAGLILDPFQGMNIAALTKYERAHVWYGRWFQAGAPGDAESQLVFEGVDCIADIYLNGRRYPPFELEAYRAWVGLLSAGTRRR
jgi:beta-mannosidase